MEDHHWPFRLRIRLRPVSSANTAVLAAAPDKKQAALRKELFSSSELLIHEIISTKLEIHPHFHWQVVSEIKPRSILKKGQDMVFMFATTLISTAVGFCCWWFCLFGGFFWSISPEDELYAIFISLLFSHFRVPLYFSTHLCLLRGKIGCHSSVEPEPFPRHPMCPCW